MESFESLNLSIVRERLKILQVNLGYKCNQACIHCHVNAGPKRNEEMSKATVHDVLDFMGKESISEIDLTGGAPEMNANFRFLVKQSNALGAQVTDRCNLTILMESNYHDLPQFLAEEKVRIVASMPCYNLANVDRQRGRGVFDKSLGAMRILNDLGYGKPSSGLILDLVYNPSEPVLPPESQALELEYRDNFDRVGVMFNSLLTMTNMPINRFKKDLVRTGQLHTYLKLLRDNFDSSNLEHVMCRSTLSVDWQGYVFDCDFNQMLAIPAGGRNKLHLSQIKSENLVGETICVKEHCLGCFAGRGSSCGGSFR